MNNLKIVDKFFIPMIPPTVTHQEKKIMVKNGKPVVYEPPVLKDARQKLEAYIGQHKPNEQIENKPIRLYVIWCFPVTEKHKSGEYKTTKPDTDNLQKLLKDVMTATHFWKDDALVASETVEKFYSDHPGIYIKYEVIKSENE